MRIGTVCKFCDAEVTVEATREQIKNMTNHDLAQAIEEAVSKHIDEHVEGIIETMASVRG